MQRFMTAPDGAVTEGETHTRLLDDKCRTSVALQPHTAKSGVRGNDGECAPLLCPGGLQPDMSSAGNQLNIFHTAKITESKAGKMKQHIQDHSGTSDHLSHSTNTGVGHVCRRSLPAPQQSQTHEYPEETKSDHPSYTYRDSARDTRPSYTYRDSGTVQDDLITYGGIKIVINDYEADSSNGGCSKEDNGNEGVSETVKQRTRRRRRWNQLGKYSPPLVPHSKKAKTLTDLLKTYRLHIFVCSIFLITTLSVSLSWHFRIMAQEQLYASQAIFFNPRTREITLADPTSRASVRGHLGLDIPSWILPLHCPIVSNGDPNYKECLWKNEAELKIVNMKSQDVQCYNISWVSLGPRYAPHDCFYVHKDKWYGPSNQSQSSFPITGEFYFQPKKNYTLSNNGVFNSVVDFYWLSSSGAAIYINANSPIRVTWNESGDNQLCMRSNFSGPLYHKTNSYDYPDMNYILCNGADSLKTHIFMQNILAPPNGLPYPSDHMLQGTHWSMKNCASTSNITQEHVLGLLQNITELGFQDNHITLDGGWQKSEGDLAFNVQHFPNVTGMLETLQYNGSSLTISVSPYFQYTSQNFHKGIASSVFVKDAGGEVTGLTRFQGGLAAILDVFTEGATQWYSQKLQTIIATYGIVSFRLTYGDQAWLPYKPHFSDTDATPNKYRRVVTESFASMPGLSFVVEHTSESRHVTSIIPVVSEVTNVQGKVCITNIIETALTLGLMGYPFVMADGIRMKSDIRQPDQLLNNARPSRELYIRWVQLAISFPAYQFSNVPWEYGDDVSMITRNLTVLRQQLILDEIMSEDLRKEVGKGFPILRPVWWLDPDNMSVHDMKINNEFLIGNNFLVAPVMCEGVSERDIYVPPGVWEDVRLGTLILGPNILRSYAVTLETIPMFMRRKVVGDGSQSHLQQNILK